MYACFETMHDANVSNSGRTWTRDHMQKSIALKTAEACVSKEKSGAIEIKYIRVLRAHRHSS